MTRPHVLIAEDDPELRAVLSRGLAEEGFAPETVATGAELLARVDSELPDLLVVDIGLPDDARLEEVCTRVCRSDGDHPACAARQSRD